MTATPIEELEDKYLGKVGTPRRDTFVCRLPSADESIKSKISMLVPVALAWRLLFYLGNGLFCLEFGILTTVDDDFAEAVQQVVIGFVHAAGHIAEGIAAGVVGDAGAVPHARLLEPLDVVSEAVVAVVFAGLIERGGIHLELHAQAEAAGIVGGVFQAQMMHFAVEEVVGLQVCHVETHLAPGTDAACIEIGNPHVVEVVGMDKGSNIFGQLEGVAHVFVNPVETCELEVAVFVVFEALDKLVDIPFSGQGGLVVL